MDIQINTLEGLERVIGQDQSFELEIKRSVWNEYVRKHIVEELKGNNSQPIREQLNRSVNSELQRWVDESLYKTIKENPNYQSLISDIARKLIRSEVEMLLKDQLDSIIETQAEELKRMVADVSMKIMRSKIEEQFTNSMKSFVDTLRDNFDPKKE